LLELAVALRLRDLEIAASLVGAVIHVLRAFERTVRRQIREFQLPDSLRNSPAPDLCVVVGDGPLLYFTLAVAGSSPKIDGGIDLRELSFPKKGARVLERALAKLLNGGKGNGFGGPEGSKHARVEVSVTGIAKDLRLDS